MSWKVSDAMSERIKFIGLLQSGQRTVSGLCQEFGISRKTAYKWLERFEQEGAEGLRERSRAPHHRPRQTSPEIQEILLGARRRHPSWGPKKLKAWLEDQHEELAWPAPSTIGDLLKREGLVRRRRSRTRFLQPPAPWRNEVSEPNQEWDADFKGQFRLGSGAYCYPLTITEAFSRYLLEVRALEGTGGSGARPIFERAFRTYGMPQTLRTDNGVPFAGTGLGRLSKLSVWWLKLGIRLVRSRPSHPEDNGRHERMHRTLKAETTRPPERTFVSQQRRFDAFRKEYNQERPHEALGQRPPARVFRTSPRPYPQSIPPVEYPSHYEVRKVSGPGLISWRIQNVFVGESLVGEYVGLVEMDDGLWKVYFGPLELGILDEVECRRRKTGKVLPMSPV
jgi:putative transposase